MGRLKPAPAAGRVVVCLRELERGLGVSKT